MKTSSLAKPYSRDVLSRLSARQDGPVIEAIEVQRL
jgi:hypothetical protein